MDIQQIKDQLNQIEGYRGCLLWILQQFEREIAAKPTEKQEPPQEKPE